MIWAEGRPPASVACASRPLVAFPRYLSFFCPGSLQLGLFPISPEPIGAAPPQSIVQVGAKARQPTVKRLILWRSKPISGHAKGCANSLPCPVPPGTMDPVMTVTATSNAAGSAAWADTLLLSFAQAGYVRAEPAILQPAEPFLDLSGEDIRKSLYLTTDLSGEELCLRPDLTIPVARDYLASGRAGQPAGFSYLGPVFRYRSGQASEFLQAGIESFGRQDRAAADAEMLALALEATAAFGVRDVEIRTGDVALFNALLDALDLYPVWRRRLVKDFNRKISLEQDLERLAQATATTRSEYQGVLAALAGSDRKAALAFVTVLKRFLSISGNPDDAIAELRALTIDAKLDLAAAIDQFESRVGFMAARGVDVKGTRFSTAFGRGLDYYTGFEFELHHKGNGTEPLVAGGRYDGLMTQLGSAEPIAAVGFSVWVDALTRIGRKVGA